ncbi:integrase [Xenorhabdus budapestensis]|uniref:Integrase n=1 Tax=Xenorhabdus budapestensis TaxID=290110 RepID=A0A2D0ISH4_XENBU|nr:integrase [Xenorhabdus budapestensis]
MMAEMQLQDVSARLQASPFVTLYEPACGKRYIPSFKSTPYMLQ